MILPGDAIKRNPERENCAVLTIAAQTANSIHFRVTFNAVTRYVCFPYSPYQCHVCWICKHRSNSTSKHRGQKAICRNFQIIDLAAALSNVIERQVGFQSKEMNESFHATAG